MPKTSATNSKSSKPVVPAAIRNSQCYKYANDVLTGKIVAGKKVKAACARFMGDLIKSQKASYRWKFDIEKAYRPINYIERFCAPTKGHYDRMELMPWQHFVEANIYGWVDKKTGLRRFREALIIVGRGNGKSTLVVGNAEYGASKDGEPGAEVYLLANSKEQAGIIFNECKEQIRLSPLLRKHFRALRDVIYYDATSSKIQHRASDSKKLDGLNPHMAIFDEIHEYVDFKLVNVIKRPMLKKRRNPLIIYITTMGTVLDGPLMSLYVMADGILNGLGAVSQAVADRIFCYVAEIDEGDDVDNPECWIKANPSMGKLFTLQDLIEDWERAKFVPEERADFINKQLDVFVQDDEMSYLDPITIRRNNKTIPLEELEGRRCYGGFDLSETQDFTSACLEFPFDDGYQVLISHSWTTEAKAKANHEKIDYAGLRREGLLTICQGEYVDYRLVYAWFLEQAKKYKIMGIGYDPANAHFLVNELASAGLSLTPIRQGYITLNAPLKNLKEAFLDGKVIHNNNRMYNWYLSNVKLVRDRNGNWLPTRKNKYRKIDGFAAHWNAHANWMDKSKTEIPEDKKVATIIKLRARGD